MSEKPKLGGPWRAKEKIFTKREPGDFRPGKTQRDHARGKGRRHLVAEESK